MTKTTEFAAMIRCRDALEGLPQVERNRILHWLSMWVHAQEPQDQRLGMQGMQAMTSQRGIVQ